MPSEESENEITAPAGDGIAVDMRIACLRFKPPDDPDVLGPAWRDHLAPIFEVRYRPRPCENADRQGLRRSRGFARRIEVVGLKRGWTP
ncbi:hypothetical protein [Methylobacterium sp. E-066]|uniref:hypothetical protein n=1 Tax=Methylobacterium sp. E-066 TaxID=2836584 RepID=UPI001FBAFE9E|nr:hypothetical protein [Methylobacterium sp. E-066]MCJ2142349.1 hypothetical protein [Methylobacterium sp. E-066]